MEFATSNNERQRASNRERINADKRRRRAANLQRYRELDLKRRHNPGRIEQVKAANRKRMNTAAKYLDQFKMNLSLGHCSHEGCIVPWQVCDVDHTNPNRKKADLSACHTVNALKMEIAKNTDTDGRIHLQLLCPVHHRIKTYKDSEEHTTHKDTAIRNWKKAQRMCRLCPFSIDEWPLFCFDADHIDRLAKVRNVSFMKDSAQFSVADVDFELSKCRMLCATCHRVRTAKQFGWRWATEIDIGDDEIPPKGSVDATVMDIDWVRVASLVKMLKKT